MLYNGAGRGDHARIMMTASTLCIDTVEAAQKIDATMPDLRAFILSIEAPSYPWEVDATLADAGEVIFNATQQLSRYLWRGRDIPQPLYSRG